jgi:hypothetical protein
MTIDYNIHKFDEDNYIFVVHKIRRVKYGVWVTIDKDSVILEKALIVDPILHKNEYNVIIEEIYVELTKLSDKEIINLVRSKEQINKFKL